jgi:hypothetical protein
MKELDGLRALFSGAEHAYGVFVPNSKVNGQGKVEGECRTEKKEVTKELWEEHIKGTVGLGIIPILDENKCKWGCIDIDVYKPPTAAVLKTIADYGLPLSVCHSKSGGLHIFLFMKSPILASTMQTLIGSLAIKLKVGNLKKDLYPRQSKVPPNGTGNWLNMPYFGSTRRGLDRNGNELTLEQFLKSVVLADEGGLLKALAIKSTYPDPEAPPCVQRILEEPVLEGDRNTLLFNYAILLKKKSSDDIPAELHIMNAKCCKPPLPHATVQDLGERVAKSTYTYQCNASPLKDCCDRALCLTRRFGIGRGGGIPVVESVTQYEEDDGVVRYVLGFKGEEEALAVDSEELYSQPKFRRKFYDAYGRNMPKQKNPDWEDLLGKIGELRIKVPILEGLETNEMLKTNLEEFVSANLVENKAEVKEGGVWIDKNNRANFRIEKFFNWLKDKNFPIKRGALTRYFRGLPGNETNFPLSIPKGNGQTTTTRVVRIPMTLLDEPTRKLPEDEGDAV